MCGLDVRSHLQSECGWDEGRMAMFDRATGYLVDVLEMKREEAQLAATDAILAVFEPELMPPFGKCDSDLVRVKHLTAVLKSDGINDESAEELASKLNDVIGSW